MKKLVMLLLLAIPIAVAAGYSLSKAGQSTATDVPPFHDLRINSVESFSDLIEPDDPEIVKLAQRLKTYEEAYRFVSDEIRFAPFVPSGPVRETLLHGVGSCLGKAALLCSLYRAMGMPKQDVRLVMGIVSTPAGPADHVWLDLEYQGSCLQQDPSGMLGRFGFAEFPNTRYADSYAIKETFCFNETHFAVVSQLNRFRDSLPGR